MLNGMLTLEACLENDDYTYIAAVLNMLDN